MSLDPQRIQSIVADVLDQIERVGGDGAQPLGVHATLDEAVAAARRSFEAFRDVPLETRARIIASIRAAMLAHLDTLASLAVEETGLAVRLAPGAPVPFDVDVHEIPARKEEPTHSHLDVRCLCVADDATQLKHDPSESHGAQWLSFEKALALADDPSLKRMIRKAQQFVAR